jgi:hypothetical protein
MIVVVDARVFVAPVGPAEPVLDSAATAGIEKEEGNLVGVFVLDDSPGVLRPEARVGQDILVENDRPRIRACAAALDDSNRDLLLDEAPVEPACVERRSDRGPSGVAPAVKDVVASHGPRLSCEHERGEQADPRRDDSPHRTKGWSRYAVAESPRCARLPSPDSLAHAAKRGTRARPSLERVKLECRTQDSAGSTFLPCNERERGRTWNERKSTG